MRVCVRASSTRTCISALFTGICAERPDGAVFTLTRLITRFSASITGQHADTVVARAGCTRNARPATSLAGRALVPALPTICAHLLPQSRLGFACLACGALFLAWVGSNSSRTAIIASAVCSLICIYVYVCECVCVCVCVCVCMYVCVYMACPPLATAFPSRQSLNAKSRSWCDDDRVEGAGVIGGIYIMRC
jgi:hypothetical protein